MAKIIDSCLTIIDFLIRYLVFLETSGPFYLIIINYVFGVEIEVNTCDIYSFVFSYETIY